MMKKVLNVSVIDVDISSLKCFVQIGVNGDVFRFVATQNGSSVGVLNDSSKWTNLKLFRDFSFFDNNATLFIDACLFYLSKFLDDNAILSLKVL